MGACRLCAGFGGSRAGGGGGLGTIPWCGRGRSLNRAHETIYTYAPCLSFSLCVCVHIYCVCHADAPTRWQPTSNPSSQDVFHSRDTLGDGRDRDGPLNRDFRGSVLMERKPIEGANRGPPCVGTKESKFGLRRPTLGPSQ